ncbi:MAG: hypothetical protein ABI112_17935 [Terracoccus sp.]
MTGILAFLLIVVPWPIYAIGKHRGLGRHTCQYIAKLDDRPPLRSVLIHCACGVQVETPVTVKIHTDRHGIRSHVPELDLANLITHRWIHEEKATT